MNIFNLLRGFPETPVTPLKCVLVSPICLLGLVVCLFACLLVYEADEENDVDGTDDVLPPEVGGVAKL